MTRSFDQYLASIRVPTPDAPEAVSADMQDWLLSRPFPDDAADSMVRSIQSFFNLKPNDPILLVAIGTIDGARVSGISADVELKANPVEKQLLNYLHSDIAEKINSISAITANCLLREEKSKEQDQEP